MPADFYEIQSYSGIHSTAKACEAAWPGRLDAPLMATKPTAYDSSQSVWTVRPIGVTRKSNEAYLLLLTCCAHHLPLLYGEFLLPGTRAAQAISRRSTTTKGACGRQAQVPSPGIQAAAGRKVVLAKRNGRFCP